MKTVLLRLLTVALCTGALSGLAPVVSAHATEGSQAAVDLNRASVEQLVELKGIGQALADAIVRYRADHGAFTAVEDLTEIRGIGPSLLQKLEGQITVAPERP